MRLGKLGDSFGDRHHAWDANKALDDVDSLSKVEALSDHTGENIDCCDLRQRSEFVSFLADLSGRQGVRGFLKHLQGGGIIADTAGPLQVIWTIGGTRAALASSECARYPYNGVAPADDIRAVGCR